MISTRFAFPRTPNGTRPGEGGKGEGDADHGNAGGGKPKEAETGKRRKARVRKPLLGPHVPDGLRVGKGMEERAHRPVRAVVSRPFRDGPALRAGDLRGDESVPRAGRRGLPLPSRPERGAPEPLG